MESSNLNLAAAVEVTNVFVFVSNRKMEDVSPLYILMEDFLLVAIYLYIVCLLVRFLFFIAQRIAHTQKVLLRLDFAFLYSAECPLVSSSFVENNDRALLSHKRLFEMSFPFTFTPLN